MHKEINRKHSYKNEHLYTNVDSSPTFLLCETLEKSKQGFSKKWYFIELKNKNKTGVAKNSTNGFFLSKKELLNVFHFD
jgi:hypothetical protein